MAEEKCSVCGTRVRRSEDYVGICPVCENVIEIITEDKEDKEAEANKSLKGLLNKKFK